VHTHTVKTKANHQAQGRGNRHLTARQASPKRQWMHVQSALAHTPDTETEVPAQTAGLEHTSMKVQNGAIPHT